MAMAHVECSRCGKKGHFQQDCRSELSPAKSTFGYSRHGGNSRGNRGRGGRHWRERRGDSESGSQTYATFLVRKNPRDKKRAKTRNKWIIHSGATRHKTNSEDAVEHLRTATNEYVAVGEGTKKQVRGQGNVPMDVLSNGAKRLVVISNVAVVPERLCSFLSVRCLRRGGYRVEFKGRVN